MPEMPAPPVLVLLVVDEDEFREAMARLRAEARGDLEDVLLEEQEIARDFDTASAAVDASAANDPSAADPAGSDPESSASRSQQSSRDLSRLAREQSRAGGKVRRAGGKLQEVAEALLAFDARAQRHHLALEVATLE